MRELPSGTVTFLFTDVEGSTALLHELGADAYAEALAEHRRVLRETFERHGGAEVDTQGDAFFVAFPTAPGALDAAQQAQAALRVPVRMGLHTGTPLLTDEGYIGADVHKAARIAAAGHGGQVLVSSATAALVDASDIVLLDLGEHRLKDLSAPERLYQVGEGDFLPLRTLYRTNLPVPATPFLGREQELAEVRALLSRGEVRLLTLTGPGGTGKTRLSLQAAGAAADGFPAGVFWVPLAPLRDPELVLDQAAQAVGATNGLADHIADKHLLLLLDNFEHLIDASARLSELVARCPNLKLLVTSRELLRVPGEQAYPVPPLEPQEGAELFVARARAFDPGFSPTPAVTELCSRLDGLPLALELAAARVRVLSPEQLLERLSKRLDLLKGGRGVDPRQQTLRATIEWSYELLDEEEQRLFARLSVFRGGCTLETAEMVCGADLDVLQSLVDKSLVRHNEGRFWMLETIRELAAEGLEASAESEELQRRLAAGMLELAREAKPHLVGSQQQEWLRGLEVERDNFRAALEWALGGADYDLGLELATVLGRFWWTRGPREGLGWLERALTHAEVPAARAAALEAAGGCAWFVGPPELAERLFDEGLELYRDLGDRAGAAMMLARLGPPLILAGRVDDAAALAEEAVAIQRELGDVPELAISLHILGSSAYERGDRPKARELLEESLLFARKAGDSWMIAGDSYQLAYIALHDGDLVRASTYSRDGLHVAYAIGDRLTGLVCLSYLAAATSLSGEARQAGLIWGAAERLDEELGDNMWRRERPELEELLTDRNHLFEDGVAQGRTLSLGDVVALLERDGSD